MRNWFLKSICLEFYGFGHEKQYNIHTKLNVCLFIQKCLVTLQAILNIPITTSTSVNDQVLLPSTISIIVFRLDQYQICAFFSLFMHYLILRNAMVLGKCVLFYLQNSCSTHITLFGKKLANDYLCD